MADDQAPDRPNARNSDHDVSQPHDKYFYAAGLLRAHLPADVASTLNWSSLTHLPGRFVSDDWRGREADLLFSVERPSFRRSGARVRAPGASVHARPLDAAAVAELLHAGVDEMAAGA